MPIKSINKYRKIIFIIIINLFVFNFDFGKTSSKFNDRYVEDRVKACVTKFIKKYKIPGIAIALYVNSKPYLFNFGYSNLAKKILVTNETLFEIGSISKIFTCLLLAQMVLENNWCLNDPIGKYIPELRNNRCLKAITLEKLATHSSSLPFNAPSSIKNQKNLLKYLSNFKQSSGGRCYYQYSNHAIELLRIALEEKLNLSFDNILKEKILIPLNMEECGTKNSHIDYNRYSICYDKDCNQEIYWNHPFLIGSAAILASNKDMLKFLHAAICLPDTPISIEKAMHLTQTPFIYIKEKNLNHGLGWQINNMKNFYSTTSFTVFNKIEAKKINNNKKIFSANAIFDKGGTTNGFHAYIAVSPSEKNGIVIMINKRLTNGWDIIKDLGKQILASINKSKINNRL